MMRRTRAAAALALFAGSALPLAVQAYPGGTPGYQTDAAPFCASCHASRDEAALAGVAGDRATKELVANKHLAVIRAGKGGYEALSEGDRQALVAHIQKLDANSTVTLKAPEEVKPGQTFEVTVEVTGGAGPVVGIALVDGAHRWHARPISSAGWQVVAPPQITGQDFKEQTGWLGRRPEGAGRNLSFVNVTGIASDASKEEWGRANVVFTLRAPSQPGTYPMGAVYFYGTEKGTPLGYEEDPIRGKKIRGGFGGGSGRVVFTPVQQVLVK